MEPAPDKKAKRGGKIEGRAPIHNKGNRCGHNRLFPSELAQDPIFFVFRKGQSPVLGNLSANPKEDFNRSVDVGVIARELGRAYANPEILPSFSYHLKKNTDGSPRLSRSEGRACALALARAAITHLDWASMRVGSYNNYTGEFDSRSLSFLGYSAHLAHRDLPKGETEYESYTLAARSAGFASERIKSASLKLQKAGFWNLGKKYEQYETIENGVKVTKTISKNYVKSINPEFLLQIPGVSNQLLKRLRDWSVKERAKRKEAAVKDLRNSLKSSGTYHAPATLEDMVKHFQSFKRPPSVQRIRAYICMTEDGRSMNPTQTLVMAEEIKALLDDDDSPPGAPPPPEPRSPIAEIIQKHLH